MKFSEEKPYAESLGWTAELDKRRGGDCCKFSKDNSHVWEVALTGRGVFWARAEIVDDYFVSQRYFNELEDVLQDKNCQFRLGKYGSYEACTSE